MTAALMKGMTASLSRGVEAPFITWETYAMVVSGIAGMVLMQNALQAGTLVAAQPGITLLDPITAIAWGILAFDEHVNGGLWLAVSAAGILAIAAGAVLLSHAPALQSAAAQPAAHQSTTGSIGAGCAGGSSEPGPPIATPDGSDGTPATTA